MIWNEWIENLALRRSYYLELDHFEARKEELDYLASLKDPEDIVQIDRPPYLPHPEVRETVPNVSLYSALYRLPPDYYVRSGSPNMSTVDKQISATIDFFNKCVPSQPGYSSSVAAVTILPDSSHVANAWKVWYQCSKKLRRLRLIRKCLRTMRHNNEGDVTSEAVLPPTTTVGHSLGHLEGEMWSQNGEVKEGTLRRKRAGPNALFSPNATWDNRGRGRSRYSFASYNKDRASVSVGLSEEAKLEMFLSDDGLEQLAVYCREFAQR